MSSESPAFVEDVAAPRGPRPVTVTLAGWVTIVCAGAASAISLWTAIAFLDPGNWWEGGDWGFMFGYGIMAAIWGLGSAVCGALLLRGWQAAWTLVVVGAGGATLALGWGVLVGAWALLVGAVPAALVVVLLFTRSARAWFPELFYAR